MIRFLMLAGVLLCSAAAHAQTAYLPQPLAPVQLAPGATLAPVQPLVLDAESLTRVCLTAAPTGQGSLVVSEGTRICAHGVPQVCSSGRWVTVSQLPITKHDCPR